MHAEEKTNMSLESLPPVNKYWRCEELEQLTLEELEKLQLILARKQDIVADHYERKLFNRDRDRFMQLKTMAFKQMPKRDCTW